MRHGKHNHILGVKKEHCRALLANLATALITNGKIETTLAKAKALRPFIEKIITLAKRASCSEIMEHKLHFRRLAIARTRCDCGKDII
jgi:large subunit ribosomal protein L17